MNNSPHIIDIPKSDKPAPQIRQATDGDDLCALFNAEETPLLHYAFSLVGRRAIAEEIVQEVFLQLHSRWDTVENPKAWLYRSVRNRSYNHHRDTKKEILTDGDDEISNRELPNESSTPEALLQKIEAAGFLRLLLAELDEVDRQLVELKYFQNLKYAEISEQSGISVSNVGYRLHHILKHLAGELTKLGIDSSTPRPSIPS